jgi:hypothetical protein
VAEARRQDLAVAEVVAAGQLMVQDLDPDALRDIDTFSSLPIIGEDRCVSLGQCLMLLSDAVALLMNLKFDGDTAAKNIAIGSLVAMMLQKFIVKYQMGPLSAYNPIERQVRVDSIEEEPEDAQSWAAISQKLAEVSQKSRVVQMAAIRGILDMLTVQRAVVTDGDIAPVDTPILEEIEKEAREALAKPTAEERSEAAQSVLERLAPYKSILFATGGAVMVAALAAAAVSYAPAVGVGAILSGIGASVQGAGQSLSGWFYGPSPAPGPSPVPPVPLPEHDSGSAVIDARSLAYGEPWQRQWYESMRDQQPQTGSAVARWGDTGETYLGPPMTPSRDVFGENTVQYSRDFLHAQASQPTRARLLRGM